uniref:Cystatin domain-containing protein n=1 Tax=Strongyloides venezuelensis TaxID=75913 RepID=A0A0K0G4D4_STRVS
MKYLITFIVISIITFVTINAKRKPKPSKKTTPPPSPPKWKNWNGTQPYSAKEIVKNATKLYYNKTGIYYNVTEIFLNQTRIINGTKRYRVKYIAVQCILDKEKESQKSGRKKKSPKKKKPQCSETVLMETPLQAVLRDDTQQNQLVLNVTNLFTEDSYEEIYKKTSKKKKRLKKN